MEIPNTKNVTILLYRCFSCGNFLSNILCYNKNFIPKIPGNLNLEDYFNMDLKHKIIMDTIPTISSELVNWRKYELGCMAFYNFYLGDLFEGRYHKFNYSTIILATNASKNINPIVIELLKSNGHLFITAHEVDHMQAGKIIFPKSKVIQLVNDDLIRKLSINLKIAKPVPGNIINEEELPTVESAHQFDIGTLFNKEDFFNEVNKLLNSYDIEDKTLDPRVNEYYEKYVALYV